MNLLPDLRPSDPKVRWSALRSIILSSNLVTVLFGGVVVFGLPEALLTEHDSCGVARDLAIDMGQSLIWAVAALSVVTIGYIALAPAPFRDHQNFGDYFGSVPGADLDTVRKSWAEADVDWPYRRLALIVLLAICAMLFFLFLTKSLDFLEASRACTLPPQTPPPVHPDISVSIQRSALSDCPP